MKTYFELIKEELINFDKILFDYYHKLNLNETECLVIYHLHTLLINNDNSFNVSKLENKMSINYDEISNVIINLVNKGFIHLELKNDTEVFNLDGTYKQLSFILENNEQNDNNKTINLEFKNLVKILEEKFNKIITPNELTIVKKWFYDYKYDINIINEEVEKISKKKTGSIAMVDRSLYIRTKEPTDGASADAALEFFNKTYGSKKQSG